MGVVLASDRSSHPTPSRRPASLNLSLPPFRPRHASPILSLRRSAWARMQRAIPACPVRGLRDLKSVRTRVRSGVTACPYAYALQVTIFGSVGLNRYYGHDIGGIPWPYISDTAKDPPQSGLFAYGLTVVSCPCPPIHDCGPAYSQGSPSVWSLTAPPPFAPSSLHWRRTSGVELDRSDSGDQLLEDFNRHTLSKVCLYAVPLFGKYA